MKTKLSILGFVTGLASASLGIGGGTIVIPGLVFIAGHKVRDVLGIALATAVPTALTGIAAHFVINAANIKLAMALFIVMGSVPGSRLGVWLVTKMNNKILSRLFAGLLVFAGLRLTGVINMPTESFSSLSLSAYPFLIILGLLTGFTSALFGVGGGIIMVPALSLFFGLSMHQAIATSLTAVLPTALAGSFFHAKRRSVSGPEFKERIYLLTFLIPLALIGAVLGAIIANSLPQEPLKIIFGVFMTLSAVKIFFSSKSKINAG